jgi:bidirectional [NiFe] hydrogenase diaphorase subunit
MNPSVKVITLVIDGKDVSAREDQTILEVARENGIRIPTLCHLDGLTAIGACRVCVVEVEGIPKLLPACVTKVTEGWHVITDSERLRAFRKTIVEFLFSERNHICSVCVSNGHCELQNLAKNLGVTSLHVPYKFPKVGIDASHARFIIDHNRCVLCARCVRVCDEIEGAHTWDVMGRGFGARVITDMNQPWGSSTSCTSCGKCVHVCPTGALSEKGKAVGEQTKRQGFLPYLTVMREERE